MFESRSSLGYAPNREICMIEGFQINVENLKPNDELSYFLNKNPYFLSVFSLLRNIDCIVLQFRNFMVEIFMRILEIEKLSLVLVLLIVNINTVNYYTYYIYI